MTKLHQLACMLLTKHITVWHTHTDSRDVVAVCVYVWSAAAGPKWMLPTEVNTAVWTKGDGQLVNPFWHLRQCSTPARGFHLLGLLHNSSRCSQLQLSNLEAVGHTPIQQGTACLPAAAAWQLVTGQEGAGGQLPAVAPLLLASGDYAPYYAHNVIHTRCERMAGRRRYTGCCSDAAL
jgi:hypothetical protein